MVQRSKAIPSSTPTLEVEHHFEKLKQLCKAQTSGICSTVFQKLCECRDTAAGTSVTSEIQLHKRVVSVHKIDDWDSVQQDNFFSAHNQKPTQSLHGIRRKDELNAIHKEAFQTLKKLSVTSFELVKVLTSYVRYRNNVGKEYVIDMLVRNTNNHTVEQRRVSLMRPEAPGLVAVEDVSPEVLHAPIHFVVPAHNRVERLKGFLKSYESACLKEDGNCKLHIVMYDENEIITITKELEQMKHSHPHFRYDIVKGTGSFNRGRARHLGMAELQNDHLAFMVDVDVNVDKDSLNRCRQNTIQNERVYFPIVFKNYNMEFVYPGQPPKNHYDITEKHGYWCEYGYGVICMYKSDYNTVGGFSSGFDGWGGEDTDIVGKCLGKSLDVFRAPDPGLIHQFHYNNCSGMSGNQKKFCETSRNEALADKVQLADFVYKTKQRV